MFCKHNWKMIHEVITKSKAEHAKDLGFSITKGNTWMLERLYIQTFKCEKCGKIKRFVQKI